MNMDFAAINPFNFPELMDDILLSPLPNINIALQSPTEEFVSAFRAMLNAYTKSNLSGTVLVKTCGYKSIDDEELVPTKYRCISIPYPDGKSRKIHLVYNIVHDTPDNGSYVLPPLVFPLLTDEIVILVHGLLSCTATIQNKAVVKDILDRTESGSSSVTLAVRPVFEVVDQLYSSFESLYKFIYDLDRTQNTKLYYSHSAYLIFTTIYQLSIKLVSEMNINTTTYENQDRIVLDHAFGEVSRYIDSFNMLIRTFTSLKMLIDFDRLKIFMKNRDDSVVSEVLARANYMRNSALILSIIDT